ncbi:CNNM family magnesium/cobalt transport protein CorC [Moritella sp. Urea-trap-13]|uniref:CNNM family magnesium/cobalt transport protein CorC n=1 Tax=Moritella sp. Urea-trap-13 TaxID=2058327 RepID=UPI000C34D73B|nr:CNNM family magnesium/cobalt transport protein CorC [Moritella sp. Urea-trap-13]PKH05746.1 magnesium/cobalt transporter CorC [Moritella sp. Urea-trap-13]
MNDDKPHSTNGSSKKGFFEKFSQLFQGEPRNREELVEVIQDAENRELIDQDTKDMIEGVLEVAGLKVRDIMIPRSQMITIDKSQGVDEFLPIMIDSAHSRFPVVNEDKDHIEGILLAKDLLKFVFAGESDSFELSSILRPAVVVPESKRVDKLLKEFRSKRYHMAVVVDEFGGVSGLVTIEDILEEIVGDIEDEFDEDESAQEDIRRINKSVFSVQALTPVDDFNDYFSSRFSDDEVDTIGGMIAHAFGHLPEQGEIITVDGYQFKVISADRRRIIQLQVKIPEAQQERLAESA